MCIADISVFLLKYISINHYIDVMLHTVDFCFVYMTVLLSKDHIASDECDALSLYHCMSIIQHVLKNSTCHTAVKCMMQLKLIPPI